MDGRSASLGVGGQLGARNAPTGWNAAFQSVLFWDGRAPSLEEQAKGPPLNPKEMGMPSLEAVAQRVREGDGYREMFRESVNRVHSMALVHEKLYQSQMNLYNWL